MKVCTIDDLEEVKNILMHDDIYPYVKIDGFEPVSVEMILESPLCYILMPHPEIVCVFYQVNNITFDMHTNALKTARGKTAIKAAKEAMAWMYENTDCLKIISTISTEFQNVYRFTKNIGMVKEGIITKSIMRNGKVYDQFIVGASKEV